MVGHHPTKFGGHRHCGMGDMMSLIYHTISQNHVNQDPSFKSHFTGRCPSNEATTLPSLVPIVTVIVIFTIWL